MPSSISSVDVFEGKLLFVSRAEGNYRDAWLYENYELKQIITNKDKLLIKEARFVDNNHIVFATVDADIILYEMSEKYQVYHHHISQSALSDIVLSQDKKSLLFLMKEERLRFLILKMRSKTEKFLQKIRIIFFM